MRKTDKALRAAISALGRSRRHALAASLAGRRNAYAGRDRALAEFYNALACLVADVSDDETRVLRALQDDQTPPAA